MHALAFLRHHPHAGWPRSHLTFRVLHLRRRQLSVLRVGASAMGKHSRFTADAQGTLPFARRAALASVVRFICTRALVAPRRRVGRMVRQLCSAVGARRLLVGCRAAGSGRWVHGERLDWGVAAGACRRLLRRSKDRTLERSAGLWAISIFPRFRNQSTTGLLHAS